MESCSTLHAISLAWVPHYPGAFVAIRRVGLRVWDPRGQIPCVAPFPITVIYIHSATELVSCFFSFNNVYIVEIRC